MGENPNARAAQERLADRMWNDPNIRRTENLKTRQDALDKAREVARNHDWDQGNRPSSR